MRPRALKRRLILAGFGGMLVAGLATAGVARADSVDEYTITNAAAICQFLDRNPGVLGVEVALAEIIGEDGFTPYQGGEIVARAVLGARPEHVPTLEAFVAKYSEARMISGSVGGRLPA